MKIEKDKRRVNIVCNDGSLITGTVHINPGERLLDFLNDQKESFIPVTEAEVCAPEGLKGDRSVCEKKETVFINKTAIEFVEEI